MASLDTEVGKTFVDKLVKLRNLLYRQLGVVFPTLRVDGALVPFSEGNNFRFWLNEVPIFVGRIRTGRILVNASAQALADHGIEAEEAINPANGRTACWIEPGKRPQVVSPQIKTSDTYEVLLLQISTFLRRHAKDFFTIQECNGRANVGGRDESSQLLSVLQSRAGHQALGYQTPAAIYFGKRKAAPGNEKGGVLQVDRRSDRRS